MIPGEWLEAACVRVNKYVLQTPVIDDVRLHCQIKLENLQKTGSFKIRGALNKILTLAPSDNNKILVAASAGNHGQGVALAAGLVDAQAIIFSPEHAVPAKVEAMRRLGAEVRLVKGGYEVAEKVAEDYSREIGGIWISPYNDVQVIAGQATLGLELLAQCSDHFPDVIIVPVGGGGLISGMGAALEYSEKKIRLVGAQSVASPFFHELMKTNSQENVFEKPSVADGLSGAVESGSITIPMVKQYVEDIILVTEEEIRLAIAYAWHFLGQRIEGSGAVSLAAALNKKVTGRLTCCIITGGNIQDEVLEDILREYPKEQLCH